MSKNCKKQSHVITNNSPKRVLHIVTSMDKAGQETFIMNIYRKIDRSKIQFDFLCYSNKHGDFDDEIRSMGGNIYYLFDNPSSIPGIKQLKTIWGIQKFVSKHEYRAIHIHHFHAASALFKLIGTKLGKARNVIIHSHNSYAPHPLVHKLLRKYFNVFKFYKFACSKSAAKWMFATTKNVEIVKNGVNFLDFKYSSTDRLKKRKELNIDNNKKVVLHIGRFNFQKNHSFLIEIFKNLISEESNCVLLLVGVGEEYDHINKLVTDYNLQEYVKFLGIRDDIADLMSASDLFLFPSIFEGLGIVLIEAQANGLPVLVSSVIPDEARLTKDFNVLSLEEDPLIWAKIAIKILDESQHKNNIDEIQNSGYDIVQVAKWIESFYIQLA